MKFRPGTVTGACTIAILTMTSGRALQGSELEKSPRIGVVAVQDRSKQDISYPDVDGILASLLRSEGLVPVPLAFQPTADVEYAARRAQCDYILYTDIVSIRETARSQFTRALQRMGGGREDNGRTVAQIEFRLFSVNEVLPRLSTMLRASENRTGPPPSSTALQSGIRAALAAALAREARMVQAEVRSNHARRPAEF
jgi:hypothetical protein